MDQDLEAKIRQRAYEIWQRNGCSGEPESHWLEAERELTGAPAGLGAMTAYGDYSGWLARNGETRKEARQGGKPEQT